MAGMLTHKRGHSNAYLTCVVSRCERSGTVDLVLGARPGACNRNRMLIQRLRRIKYDIFRNNVLLLRLKPRSR